MTRVLQCFLVLGLFLVLSGCISTRAPRATVIWNYPHATEATLTKTPQEHYQSVSNVAERDMRALIEDLDLLFMTERPSRLTRWHTR